MPAGDPLGHPLGGQGTLVDQRYPDLDGSAGRRAGRAVAASGRAGRPVEPVEPPPRRYWMRSVVQLRTSTMIRTPSAGPLRAWPPKRWLRSGVCGAPTILSWSGRRSRQRPAWKILSRFTPGDRNKRGRLLGPIGFHAVTPPRKNRPGVPGPLGGRPTKPRSNRSTALSGFPVDVETGDHPGQAPANWQPAATAPDISAPAIWARSGVRLPSAVWPLRMRRRSIRSGERMYQCRGVHTRPASSR